MARRGYSALSSMQVLVTGGTGFIGGALVQALRQRGNEVTVVSRRPGPSTIGWDALEGTVERTDAIVHLAGEPIAEGRWTTARLKSIRSSRIESTERIARAIASCPRKPAVWVS